MRHINGFLEFTIIFVIVLVVVGSNVRLSRAKAHDKEQERSFQKRVDDLSSITCKKSDVQTAVYVVSTKPRLCVKVDCLNPSESIAYFKYSCEEK